MFDESPPEKTAFLATKPLQIMVSMAIRDQLQIEEQSHLMVIPEFRDANLVVRRVREFDSRWLTVSEFSRKHDAIIQCVQGQYHRVFLDSDVGVRNAWTLRMLKAWSPSTRLCVFEEGIGTYRQDIYSPARGMAVRALGGSTHFGGLPATNEVWVHRPDAYGSLFPRQADKVRVINSSLQSWIASNMSQLELIFLGGPLDDLLPQGSRRGRCAVYLTAWTWRPDAYEVVRAWGGLSVLKLHPHIQSDEDELRSLFDLALPASIPAELVLLALARRFEEVAVFHHGTSTEQYIHHEGVTYFNLG